MTIEWTPYVKGLKSRLETNYFIPFCDTSKILESQQKIVKTLNSGVKANSDPDHPHQEIFLWESGNDWDNV